MRDRSPEAYVRLSSYKRKPFFFFDQKSESRERVTVTRACAFSESSRQRVAKFDESNIYLTTIEKSETTPSSCACERAPRGSGRGQHALHLLSARQRGLIPFCPASGKHALATRYVFGKSCQEYSGTQLESWLYRVPACARPRSANCRGRCASTCAALPSR